MYDKKKMFLWAIAIGAVYGAVSGAVKSIFEIKAKKERAELEKEMDASAKSIVYDMQKEGLEEIANYNLK